MRIKTYLSTVWLLFSVVANAQMTFSWANQIGGPSGQQGKAVALDQSGNIHITGGFFNRVDFFQPSDTFSILAKGDYDSYVQKLDPAGNLLWAKGIGSTDFDLPQGIATDLDGNVFLTGYFEGDIVFDSTTILSTSPDFYDIYIVKLDAAGNFVWAKQFGGAKDDQGLAIATDEFGFVYTTGFYNDTVDFDPGPDTAQFVNTSASKAMFILKLSSDGDFMWAKHMQAGPNPGESSGLALAVKGDYLYATGEFTGQVDFNPGPGTLYLTGQFNDAFVQKLSLTGTISWAKQIAGSGAEKGLSIAVDEQDNVLSTGYFSSSVDLDPGPGTANYNSAGNHDFYVQKLNPQGNFLWGKKAGAQGQDQGYGIAVDEIGNSYIIGRFDDKVDFNPGPIVNNLTAIGFSDIFVLKLNPYGNFVQVVQMGGTHFDTGYGIVVDKDNNIVTTGDFGLIGDFNTGTDSLLFEASGFDGFVQKMGQPWDYHGIVFHDQNENQLRDAGEPGLPGMIIAAQSRGIYTSTGSFGEYHIYEDLFGDTLHVIRQRPYWTVNPASIPIDTTQSLQDLGLIIPEVKDICIAMVEVSNFMPGFNTVVQVQVINVGTKGVGNIPVQLNIVDHPDPGMIKFVGADPAPLSQTDVSFNWVIDTLDVEETATFLITLSTTTSAQIDATLVLSGAAYLGNDADKSNNASRILARVFASFDPNDKQVTPTSLMPPSVDTTDLRYVIRFQNTGNSAASFVVLRDTLPEGLDLATLRILAASHPYTWRLHGDRVLEFRFDPINLPDSTTNEPESHGFAAFTVQPMNGLPIGSSIENRAGIYFDFNDPVITGWATMNVSLISKTSEPKEWLEFDLSPNPVQAWERFWLDIPEAVLAGAKITVSDVQGKTTHQISHLKGQSKVLLDGLPSGSYFVQVSSGKFSGGKVLLVH